MISTLGYGTSVKVPAGRPPTHHLEQNPPALPAPAAARTQTPASRRCGEEGLISHLGEELSPFLTIDLGEQVLIEQRLQFVTPHEAVGRTVFVLERVVDARRSAYLRKHR